MPIAKGAVIRVAAIDSGESSEPERIDSRSEENIREEEKGFPIQACAASEEARKRKTGSRFRSNSRAITHPALPSFVEAWAGTDGKIGDVTSDAAYSCVSTARVASV